MDMFDFYFLPLALSFTELAWVAVQFVVAGGLCFVVITLLASYLRFEAMTEVVEPDDEEAVGDDYFQMQVLQRIGTVHRTPEPFSLLLIRQLNPGDETLWKAATGSVREVLRSTDLVHITEESHMAVILEASRRQTFPVVERIQQVVEKAGCPTESLQLSWVSFPDSAVRYHDLMKRAQDGWEALDGQAGVQHDEVEIPEEEEEDEEVKSTLLDELTGVLKPDKLVGALQKYVARQRKDAVPVSLLYIDVDFLDRYNRHYGPEGGDAILKHLGKMIETHFRETDLVGRYDGEEFIVAAPCRGSKALIAARRFAMSVKKESFAFGSTKLKITVSIGVSSFPEHGVVPRELFNAAAAALLAAKSRGRGNAAYYDESMPTPQELQTETEAI